MPNLRGKTWTTTTPANVGDAQFWEDHLIADQDAIFLHSFTEDDIEKARTAVQSVENVLPDSSSNVNVFPPGGLQGQVLTKTADGRGNLAWEDPASSGHTVQDDHGIDMPYQEILQFRNAAVSNDSINGKTVVDCHGEKGDPGKSAYQYAIEGGYTGTETKFSEDLGNFQTYATVAEDSAEDAEAALEEIRQTLAIPTFSVDFTTGELIYDSNLTYTFLINQSTGNLEWEVI